MTTPSTSTRTRNTTCSLALLCALSAPAAAQQILQPVGISTTLPGNSSILPMIDQSGIPNYVSGVTDFATQVATSHANSTPRALSRPFVAGRTITLDLGAIREVDAIALWGLQTRGFQLNAFALFADDDDVFANGTTASLGSFNGPISQGGRAFAFTSVATRFVHIRVDANGGSNEIKIGEAAFRLTASTDDPGHAMVQPANASTSLRQMFGPTFGVGNLIDQSGFGVPYTDGVTDFAAFVPATTHSSSSLTSMTANSNGLQAGNGVVNLGETITLDLGQEKTVDALAVWSTSIAVDAMLGFALFADDDGDFTNGISTRLGNFACPPTFQGQSFGFRPVTTRFVHLQITAHGGGEFVRLGELALRSAVGVVNTITHSGNFVGAVAYDPVSDEVIVLDDLDTINYYDRTTGVETLQFAAPGRVIGAQVDITTGNLWAVGEDEVVREIDRTGVVVSSFSVLPVVDDASALAIDPVTDTIWISNDGDNTVTEFDKSGNPTGASFTPVGSTDGDGLAYDPATRTFLLGEDGNDAILVVDRTGALLRRFDLAALGLSPEGLALDTTTGTVFCGNGTVAQTVTELTNILAAPPAGALTRYGTPCGARIAASDIVVDDGATESGLWIGYEGALPPGSAFLLVLGTARQNLPLATIVPSPCTAFALPDVTSFFGTTNSAGRGGIRLVLPPGFPGVALTAWGADIDLVNGTIPSSSGGLEIVMQ